MILAILALSAALMTSTPAPVPAADNASQQEVQNTIQSLDPLAGVKLTACTATAPCPSPFDGVPVTCIGNFTCQVNSFQVVCDGVSKDCNCAIAPSGCYDPTSYCICIGNGNLAPYCRRQSC